MATLDELTRQVRSMNGKFQPMPAGMVETLQPEAFLEEYSERPKSPIVIGLRTPNSADYRKAEKCATDDEAKQLIVAVGICDPNDCSSAHPAIPFADVVVERGMKPATVSYLFDRIERLHIETSPAVQLATDEELFLLGDALQSGELLDVIESESTSKAARIRRLATALIDALGVET